MKNNKNVKVVTVLGTRPEIIKLSPLIPLLDEKFNHILIHTGQHYDYEMDSLFFKELQLKQPSYNLKVGSHSQGKQTAIMLENIEEILILEKPDMVIVQGDTNSTLSGALAASKLHIPVAHIEAGCRSFNRYMPEEINRVIADHISDILFASDKKAGECLLKEGIPREKIFLTGSTAFDVCLRNKEFITNSNIDKRLKLTKNQFILVTLHRAENTNNPQRFKNIIDALNSLSEAIDIVFPIHPRTAKIVKQHNIKMNTKIKVTKPLGYIDFIKLMSQCRIIFSDSGGVQEEAIVFNKPCLIPREDSEWMRLIEAGKNFLVGIETQSILKKTREFITDDTKLNQVKAIKYPYDKNVSKKILALLSDFLKK